MEPNSLRKLFLQDLGRVLILLCGCFLAGLAANELGSAPLPLVYASPGGAVPPAAEGPPAALGPDVAVDEMRSLSANHAALILDARPPDAYRAGHIPSALNLPSDDFDRQYEALPAIRQAPHNQLIVVYCSILRCRESEAVAEELVRAGYTRVRIFRGGMFDWENARLPEEKE